MIVARVVNDEGRAFNVRVVRPGDRYGRNDFLVHDKDESLVEFWDATYEHDPRFTPGLGQFVNRYFLGTLTGEDDYSHRPRGLCGLDLCGHEPAWKLTAGNVEDAVAAAAAEVARG